MIGVDLAFATGQVDPPDRLAAWRELVSRAFLPLAITPLGGDRGREPFEGSVTGRHLGGLQVWLVTASPMSAVRARRHIEASGDDYLLALHVRGTAHATQDGREVTLGPGDLALFDSSRPYSIAFPGPGAFEHVIFQVPRASLDARRDLGAVTAMRVPSDSGAGRLVSPYLRRLALPGPGRGRPPQQAFVDAGLDLAVSALREAGGLGGRADPGRRSPLSELKEQALARLSDPRLSPEAVARVGYVSVRQLHRLFAREGLTFGGWVREQRLRRCRDDLADLRLGHLTVAEIAERWGFRSAAHFSRAFEARYGVTPSACRRPKIAGLEDPAGAR
jgi:AraC-like DNA-binding protein